MDGGVESDFEKVNVQKETQRQRALELLQVTANPIDLQITGMNGRAELLRAVVDQVGIDGAKVIPDAEEIEAKQAAMMAGGAPGAPGAPGGAPANGPAPAASTGAQAPAPAPLDGPRVNLMQQTPQQ